MAQYRAIIFITKDTLQTFKVVDEKYEALNSKGISYINYNSETDLTDYVEILKTKYNIDEFSEINISFSIINVGAEDKYIDSLKELLDGAERIDVNNIEKLIPLVLASKGEIKTNTALQEDYESALKKIEQLENEKNKLIEDSKKQTDEIDNLVSQIASLKDEIESIKNAKIEAEKLEEQKQEKERELSKGAVVKAAPAGGKPVNAPVAGTLLKYAVAEGASVQADTTVVIIESMKMELEIKAGAAGKIHFTAPTGSQVTAGQAVASVQ